jgi:hypothetical protein
LSEDAIFSLDGSFVMRVRHAAWPSATESFWIRPSGDAA